MKRRILFDEIAPKRVIIFRALQLGDLMCAVPAFRSLRAALPEAVISLVGLPWAKTFVERFNYLLDDFIEFPGYPGFPERAPQIHDIPRFLTEIQWLEYDLAIQMQGSGSISNPLVELFGAQHIAGYSLPSQYSPNKEYFMDYPVHEPEVWRHLRLMEYLGAPLQGDDLEFPLYRKDWAEYQGLAQIYGLEPGGYICLHPGARAETRRWPLDRFAAVADGLAGRGLKVVLTGAEVELTQAVAAQMRMPVVDLGGKTSLGGVGALISNARLVVCNDTGVSHLAAALLTPSVVLFSASDPNRWAPKDQRLHRTVAWASAAMPDLVLKEAEQLMEERAHVI